jgi:hypothetical protein
MRRREKGLTFDSRLIEVLLDWFVYGRSPREELRIRWAVLAALALTIALTAAVVITHT